MNALEIMERIKALTPAEQREVLSSRGVSALRTPRERVYVPADPAIAIRLRLAAHGTNP